jgi:hypothetical protein
MWLSVATAGAKDAAEDARRTLGGVRLGMSVKDATTALSAQHLKLDRPREDTSGPKRFVLEQSASKVESGIVELVTAYFSPPPLAGRVIRIVRNWAHVNSREGADMSVDALKAALDEKYGPNAYESLKTGHEAVWGWSANGARVDDTKKTFLRGSDAAALRQAGISYRVKLSMMAHNLQGPGLTDKYMVEVWDVDATVETTDAANAAAAAARQQQNQEQLKKASQVRPQL